MNDLIKQVRQLKELKYRGYTLLPQSEIDMLDEVIVALSPVLPEDVQKEVRHLHFEHERRAAHMLERLALSSQALERGNQQLLNFREEDQKRIAELEAENKELKAKVKRMFHNDAHVHEYREVAGSVGRWCWKCGGSEPVATEKETTE